MSIDQFNTLDSAGPLEDPLSFEASHGFDDEGYVRIINLLDRAAEQALAIQNGRSDAIDPELARELEAAGIPYTRPHLASQVRLTTIVGESMDHPI